MRRRRTYLGLTLVISILLGIILPFLLGAKDPMLIAILFSWVWLIYAVTLFIWVFLITGRRNQWSVHGDSGSVAQIASSYQEECYDLKRFLAL
jgi:hypothetical protein